MNYLINSYSYVCCTEISFFSQYSRNSRVPSQDYNSPQNKTSKCNLFGDVLRRFLEGLGGIFGRCWEHVWDKFGNMFLGNQHHVYVFFDLRNMSVPEICFN